MKETTHSPCNGCKSMRSRSRNANKWRWMRSRVNKSSTTPRADGNTSGDCCKEKGHWFPFHGEQKARREPDRERESRLPAPQHRENQRPSLPLQSQRLRSRVLALASVCHDVPLWERARLKRNPSDAPFPEPWSSPLL